MKQLSILTILFFLLNSLSAQISWVEKMQDPSVNFYDVQSAFEDYWQNREIEKGKGWKQYKRWEYFTAPRVYPSGNRNLLGNTFTESQNYLQNLSPQNRSAEGMWEYIGNHYVPFFGGAGRVNCIAYHPNDTSIIYAGTPAGGLWKSTDGGNTWNSNTDQLPSLGISSVVINPQNPDIMYLGTGDGDGGDTYSVGVLKSTDGGNTFQSTGLNFNYNSGYTIRKLLMSPDDPEIILAATSNGIYRTINGGTNWSQITTSTAYDLEFKPGNSQIVYATGSGKFWQSTNNGASFTQITNGFPATGMTRMAMAVTPADEDYVYILAGGASQGFNGVYKSEDGGNTFAIQSDTINLLGWRADGDDEGGQAWYDLAIVASPEDPELIWTGGVNIWKSPDGGITWYLDAHWWGDGGQPYVHADIHALEFIPGNNNSFLVGCDGGVFKTTNKGETYSDLSNNLKISQIYKMAQSSYDPDKIITGWQDNGTNLKTSTLYRRVMGGDGMDCAMDYTNDNIMYGEYYYGRIYKSINNGVNFDMIVDSDDTLVSVDEPGLWVTPFILHPTDPNTMLVGKTKVYRSTDGGDNFTALDSVPGGSGMILALAYAPSNPDYIYALKSNRVFVSSDGNTFTNMTNNLSTSAALSNVAVDPNNPLRAWVTYSGFGPNSKVFFTDNGGVSWTNYGTGIPNVPVNCIVYHNGSNDGLYIGTDMGVFYRDATMTSWQYYSNGLPNTIVNDMEIYYPTNKLRAATYGRGIWESDLYSNVQNDASISMVEIPNGNVCNTSFSPIVKLKNAGDNDLTSVTIKYSMDGGTLVNYNWTGLLHPYEETILTLPVNSSTVGVHTFEIFTSFPNGMTDTQNSNDTLQTIFEILSDGNIVSFSLMPDCFGEQVSWEIQDLSGNIIQSVDAGFYEGNLVDPSASGILYTHDVCLEIGCYDFIINDVGGNGLDGSAYSCEVPGTYSMNDQIGNLLFEDPTTNGNFGASESHFFCVTSVYAAAFSASPTQVCKGSDIQFNDLSTAGTNSWNWTFPGGNPASSTVQNPLVNYASPGTYNVILQTGNGTDSHTKTMVGYITVFDSPLATIVFDSLNCFGDCNATIDLSITGGTSPVYFEWSNGSMEEDQNNVCAGNYSVMMHDENGCKDSATAIIYEPSAIDLNLSATQATCGVNDGSISSIVTGGDAPYDYLWSNGETGTSLANLGIGSYTLTIIDSNDCVIEKSIAITNPNAPDVIADGINETCGGECNGVLQSVITGGTGLVSITWTNGAGTSDTVQMVCPGTYIISAIDQDLCEDRDTVVIANGTPYPVANFVISDTTASIGQNLNIVNLSSGANQYSWDFGDGNTSAQSSNVHSYDSAGVFTVVLVACKNGCCDSDTGYIYVIDVSLVNENEKSNWINIYPNPTEDILNIQLLNGNTESEIKLYDNNGRLVLMKKENGDFSRLNISEFSKGIYFLEVNCYDTVLKYKVVKR